MSQFAYLEFNPKGCAEVLHHTALLFDASLTLRASTRIFEQPAGGCPSFAGLGEPKMGAAPLLKGQRAVASPLPDFASPTEVTIAHSGKPGPRRFSRVPTHAIGVAAERRRYPRASLCLPLRLTRVGDVMERIPVTLVTRNISSSGVFFLAPREIEEGTSIELEVALIDRPLGFGRVQMCTSAHIVRTEQTDVPGWHGYAASFDDFALERDDAIPPRYHHR